MDNFLVNGCVFPIKNGPTQNFSEKLLVLEGNDKKKVGNPKKGGNQKRAEIQK